MNVVALAGGVGGAKLAHGLALELAAQELTVVVNTGDDFEHLGLRISPDLDTVCYTLAGLADPGSGWGRLDETWHAMAALEQLSGPVWFRLGDLDIGTHLERTRRLREGAPLSVIVRQFCQSWGVRHAVLPMTDSQVATIVDTEEGELAFQEYFVHRGCRPRLLGFRYLGIETAVPAPGVAEAISTADLVVVCPSNPWVSIAPILAVPGLSPLIAGRRCVAVSPIVGGRAIKGPAAKMYLELGIEPSSLAVANHYTKIISGLVMDSADRDIEDSVRATGIRTLLAPTIMRSVPDRKRLARAVLKFGQAYWA